MPSDLSPLKGTVPCVVPGTLAGALDSLKSATPFLAREFASAGVVAVGDALGLDPRITSLIGVPVSMAVGGLAAGVLHPG